MACHTLDDLISNNLSSLIAHAHTHTHTHTHTPVPDPHSVLWPQKLCRCFYTSCSVPAAWYILSSFALQDDTSSMKPSMPSLQMPSALCTDWYHIVLLLWTMMCLSPCMLSLLDWELLNGKNCIFQWILFDWFLCTVKVANNSDEQD